MSYQSDSPDPVEVRDAVWRWLYVRRKLVHQRSAVQSGIKRDYSVDAADSDIQAALDYHTDKKRLDRIPGPNGGGDRHAVWKINSTGIDLFEELNG